MRQASALYEKCIAKGKSSVCPAARRACQAIPCQTGGRLTTRHYMQDEFTKYFHRERKFFVDIFR